MNDFENNRTASGLLAKYLAELRTRLRRSLVRPPADAAAPTVLPALAVAGRLLTAAVSNSSPPARDLLELGNQVAELAEQLGATPGLGRPGLDRSLERLAESLEGALERFDDGVSLPEVAGDPVWLRVLESFRGAGTHLAVMSELLDALEEWESNHADASFDPTQEQELADRWRRLRSYGDALFCSGPGERAAPETETAVAGDSVGILILVDSPFRREPLAAKLEAAGFEIELATDPADAAARFLAGAGAGGILCDNQEPANNLVRLRAALDAVEPALSPRLVLVTGRPGPATADARRIRALGAVGSWFEPYALEELERILGP